MKLRSLLAVLLLVTAAACHASPTSPDVREAERTAPSFEDQVPTLPTGSGWAGSGS